MEIGNKILSLRKSKNFSQEKLAEMMNVSRQTISKWELGETSPNLKEAKELAQIFKVSLDELASNDTKELLVEKVSNTEKLAGIIIQILKVFGIFVIVMFAIEFIAAILFFSGVKTKSTSEVTMTCHKDNQSNIITMNSDGDYECKKCLETTINDIEKIIDFSDLPKSIQQVEEYYMKNGGTCD